MPSTNSPTPLELPYLEVSENGYAAAVAAAFHRETTVRATALSGPCPRCHHVMEYLISATGVKGQRWERWFNRQATVTPSATSPEPSGPEDMFCTCEQEHPGRPASYLGCGAYWTLPLT
jgi:hypothetical protein